MIQYVRGDATTPKGGGARFIVHVCNNRGGWGKGFVLAISKKWKMPEEKYREWSKKQTDVRAGFFELGATQIVEVEKHLWVCNMVAQDGYASDENPVAIRYDALETCLLKVGTNARIWKGSVHMPRIGCGLAGGKWEKVEPIILKTLEGIPVTVYDYP